MSNKLKAAIEAATEFIEAGEFKPGDKVIDANGMVGVVVNITGKKPRTFALVDYGTKGKKNIKTIGISGLSKFKGFNKKK